MNFIDLKNSFLGKVYPDDLTCDLCGVEIFGGNFCADCLKELQFNDRSTCDICGRKTPFGGICMECRQSRPAFEKARSALLYGGASAHLIYKLKTGAKYLAAHLAALIAPLIGDLGAECIVCVPMTRRARRKRGYNQSALLAEELSNLSGLPFLDGAVEKIRETHEQKLLTKKEREGNLAGCFKVNAAAVKGKKVLVVDDVMTTGATLNTICRKIKSAKADKVFAVTVCSVEFAVVPNAQTRRR